MRRFGWLVISLSMAGVLTLAVDGARAEGFVDLRGGAAFTIDAPQRQTGPTAKGSGRFEESFSVGARGGYWLDSIEWLGFALDVSYFKPDEETKVSPQLELDVVPISALLMVRTPLLKNSDFPRGRLHPYAGIGPGLFVIDASVPLPGGPKFSKIDVEAGLDVRGGVAFHPLSSWASWSLLVEYRYTEFEPEIRDGAARIKTQVNSHHITAGLGFHF